MDDRNASLGEIAADAALERTSYLADAGEQLRNFLRANRDRIKDAGGMVLIDEDPDYLSVAPDGTFRSRTRYQDQATGEWHSETEVIDSAAELVELYNPAEVFAAFAEAAQKMAGLPTAGDGEADEDDNADDAEHDLTTDIGYAHAADDWAMKEARKSPPKTAAEAAQRLYDLALTFQERSQHSEARLIEQFESAAGDLAKPLGDMMVLDDEDERLWLKGSGHFEAEVVPAAEEGEKQISGWRKLTEPDALVEFYDPTDVFGDLAEALAEAHPEAISEADDDDDDDDEDDDRPA